MNSQGVKLEYAGKEKAILVGIYNRTVTKEKAEEYLEEMQLLAQTAGAVTLKVYLQKMDKVHSGTYVGKGKLEEIKAYVDEHKVDLVIFDDDLTPSQVRNIDRVLEVKVMDRSGIILHIFSERARSAQAKAQVELAQLQYLLPRLTGLWTHLSKQKGGIGMKGAGEKEIETDRRNIRFKIDLLKEDLKKIDQQNQTRRKHRGEMVRVALVGYTNAGKSTLMNRLSKSDVLAEDKLFATLDTTVRKVVVDQVPFLLSDTVGFLRKLPHDLVECFKSTLDEVRESDILLHVVDLSHPAFEEQIQVVNETLASLKANEKPTIVVFNKIDRLSAEERDSLEKTWIARENAPATFVAAGANLNIDVLKKQLLDLVRQEYKDKYPHFKFSEIPDYEAMAREQSETGEWPG
ncbi:MAG: GTPase HflX [Bacteroidetes bacterium]|nr:GTPase HflX [Bacteroidota bacterium]MBP6639248.1 GTPase HflX [Bacteroidia bacterium]MBP6720932.1 GTPase HflX [Bacteroidia bacterium]MBP8073655.1 GTPase HflX [Bacteroidia bacterium]